MAKKIFDIIPPGSPGQEKQIPIEQKGSLPKPFEEKRKLPIWWGVVPLILIFLIAVCFRISKAEIQIWPETENSDLKTKVTLDKTIDSRDVDFWIQDDVMPAQVIEAEKTVSEEFSSSGKILKKAEGVIRLYNNYTTQVENWVEGTRFVSADGKLFKSKSKIAVPGAVMKSGKMTPSFVDVEVVAAEPGSDYNIEPSHFSIIAFRGTPRYTKYYGESFQPMTGGGEFPQVKKEDLENAEKTLIEKAKTESESALKEKIPAESLFSEEIMQTEILEKFSLSPQGAEVEKFTFQVKAKSSTLSFKKEDLNSFAKGFISSQIPEDKNILDESLKIEYLVDTFDIEKGRAVLNLDVSAKTYPAVDLLSLKKSIVGKNFNETKIFLENQSYTLKTQIHFFPFWVRSVPANIEKIEIQYPLINGSN